MDVANLNIKQNIYINQTKHLHQSNKTFTSIINQTKHLHQSNKTFTSIKQNIYINQTKHLHQSNKTFTSIKQNIYINPNDVIINPKITMFCWVNVTIVVIRHHIISYYAVNFVITFFIEKTFQILILILLEIN